MNTTGAAELPEALRPEMLDDLIATFESAGRGNYNLMRVELPRHQWTQLAAALRAQPAGAATPSDVELQSLASQHTYSVAERDYPESPMKKVAQALREKAAAEREAFDRRIQSGEWGPHPEPGTEADSWVLPEPVSDVWTTFRGERCLTPAGDDYYTSVHVRAAYEAGRAAPQPATADAADAVDAKRYRWLRRWKGQEHEPPFTVQHEVDGTLWGGDLDEAIDAAIAANGGNKR